VDLVGFPMGESVSGETFEENESRPINDTRHIQARFARRHAVNVSIDSAQNGVGMQKESRWPDEGGSLD